MALRQAAAFWFFVLGTAVIASILLLRRGWIPVNFNAVLHALDLPLLLSGGLLAGTSLYLSMVPEGKSSPLLGVIITVPLLALFVFFAYLNFGVPFPTA